LVSDSFNRDNAKVYGLIKQLILEGPGQTYIMRCNVDTYGRGAWNALRAHFEGDGFQNRNIEHAYSTLESLVYEGEKKGFTFKISRAPSGMLFRTRKVQQTRSRNQESSRLKQQVKATPNLSNSFEEAINLISLSVTPLKQLQRNAAAFDQSGRNGRGHQRQDGRGNQGRGVRGRGGRGQNGRGGHGRYVPYTGYYTADEWQSLIASQHTRVNEVHYQVSQGQGQAINDAN
jgi:hypothetical protein